jgi:hypothetical protein
VWLTGHSRSVGPKCRPCFMECFLRQEFGRGSYIFGILRTPALKCGMKVLNSLQNLRKCLPDCMTSYPKDILHGYHRENLTSHNLINYSSHRYYFWHRILPENCKKKDGYRPPLSTSNTTTDTMQTTYSTDGIWVQYKYGAWWDNYRRKPKYSEKNLSQYHTVHH